MITVSKETRKQFDLEALGRRIVKTRCEVAERLSALPELELYGDGVFSKGKREV